MNIIFYDKPTKVASQETILLLSFQLYFYVILFHIIMKIKISMQEASKYIWTGINKLHK